jgi:hypothetical protein
LFAARIDPTFLMDGSEDEKGFVFLEFRIGGGAINF